MRGITDIRYETKYLVGNGVLLRALLDNYCAADQHHPIGYVFNVHFDTPTLEAYEEKKAGALSKSKLRARWYAEMADLAMPGLVKLENKRKEDRLVTKHSVSVVIKPGNIIDLLDPAFWTPIFQNQLLANNFAVTKRLHPVLISGYRRRRYTDPMTGARISLDDDIRSYVISPLVGAVYRRNVCLAQTILEIKTNRPSSFTMFANFNCIQECTFSKYASLLSGHLQGWAE